jgi:hypothetical protein
MFRTFRKVEIVAAAFYAGSFILWALGNSRSSKPESWPGEELADLISGVERTPTFSNWDVSSLALLVVAAGLTIAAVRLRRSSPQD